MDSRIGLALSLLAVGLGFALRGRVARANAAKQWDEIVKDAAPAAWRKYKMAEKQAAAAEDRFEETDQQRRLLNEKQKLWVGTEDEVSDEELDRVDSEFFNAHDLQRRAEASLKLAARDLEKECSKRGLPTSAAALEAIRESRQSNVVQDDLSRPREVNKALFGVELEVAGIDDYDGINAVADAYQDLTGLVVDNELSPLPSPTPSGYMIRYGAGGRPYLELPDGRTWKTVGDGTIDPGGREVVSPPMSLREMPVVFEIAKRLQQIGGASDADHGCGLHVHASHPSQEFWAPAIAAEGVRLTRRELPHTDPRRLGFAKPLPDAFIAGIRQNMTLSDIKGLWYETALRGKTAQTVTEKHHTRYHAFNLRALDEHGTWESRFTDGTLDPVKIRKAILDTVKTVTTREFIQPNRRRRRRRGCR